MRFWGRNGKELMFSFYPSSVRIFGIHWPLHYVAPRANISTVCHCFFGPQLAASRGIRDLQGTGGCFLSCRKSAGATRNRPPWAWIKCILSFRVGRPELEGLERTEGDDFSYSRPLCCTFCFSIVVLRPRCQSSLLLLVHNF